MICLWRESCNIRFILLLATLRYPWLAIMTFRSYDNVVVRCFLFFVSEAIAVSKQYDKHCIYCETNDMVGRKLIRVLQLLTLACVLP
jgi:hypothetical protein